MMENLVNLRALQNVQVMPGHGPCKPTSTTNWNRCGNMHKIKDDESHLWKWLRSSLGYACSSPGPYMSIADYDQSILFFSSGGNF